MKGWKGEPRRHGLARRGVKTVIDKDKRLSVKNYVSRGRKDGNLSDEFYEWLNECPVMWFRDKVDGGWHTYRFDMDIEPDYQSNRFDLSDDFYDWLNESPVMWQRNEINDIDGYVEYSFFEDY